MKKIITTSVLFLLAFSGFSQSIVLLDTANAVVSNSIVDITITPGSTTLTEFLIHNSTNQSRTYKCRRAILYMASDDSTQFCFGGLCYGFGTNVGSLSLTVVAQDTVDFAGNGFHAVFVAGASCVTRLVYYRFEDPANLADSTNVILRYNCSSGVNEFANAAGTISEVVPNPASQLISINYNVTSNSQKAKLAVYNVIGKEIKQITLTDKQGTAKLNTDDIPSGVYFYSLLVDDKIISTKKLVISN